MTHGNNAEHVLVQPLFRGSTASALSEFARGIADNINSVVRGFARNPYNTAFSTGGSSKAPRRRSPQASIGGDGGLPLDSLCAPKRHG
jgi:hypothetical protein